MKFLARNSYFLNLCVCVSLCVFGDYLYLHTSLTPNMWVSGKILHHHHHFSAANGDKGDSVCFEKAISVYEALIKNRTAFHSL